MLSCPKNIQKILDVKSPPIIPHSPIIVISQNHTMVSSIAIITASTRTPRVGPHVAALVKSLLDADAKASGAALVPVDLATFNLPVYNEAIIPGMIKPAQADSPKYAHAHSIAWSDEIKRHDAYVFVINEYNYGIAGATKNAIDYLMHEWKGKPVALVSYGIKGGAFASDQTKHILENMGLKVAATRPQLAFSGGSGPDLFAAMLQGALGDEQKATWEKEKGGEVRKAFAEVLALLKEEEKLKVQDTA